MLEQRSDNVYAISWAGCANFLPVNVKTLLFCILLCELAYSMGGCVSLRGDIAHLVLMIHALLTQLFAFVHFFVYFLYALFSSLFPPLVHQTKERNIAKGKAARGLSSAYESN